MHEYLLKSNHYEDRTVYSGRSEKWCEHCEKVIRKGTAHSVHKFYPEFNSYPTHSKCSDDFIESLRPDDVNETDEQNDKSITIGK